jgi:hypothetical protein
MCPIDIRKKPCKLFITLRVSGLDEAYKSGAAPLVALKNLLGKFQHAVPPLPSAAII